MFQPVLCPCVLVSNTWHTWANDNHNYWHHQDYNDLHIVECQSLLLFVDLTLSPIQSENMHCFFQLRHHLKPLEQTHGFILPPGLFRLIGASWARGSIFGQISEAGPGENYGLV
jgi:hypothetical protein